MQLSFDPRAQVYFGRLKLEERAVLETAGWRWHFTRKRWETKDHTQVDELHTYCDASARARLDHWRTTVRDTVALSHALDIADYDPPCPAGHAYDGYQKVGIKVAVERHTTLLAHPPGLGKTVIAIGVANADPRPVRRVLIVCEASHKAHWVRAWREWDMRGLSVGIAGTTTTFYKDEEGKRRSRAENTWPDTDVVVTNYTILPRFEKETRAVEWDLLICDEAHALTNGEAIRTKMVFGSLRKTKAAESRSTGRKWVWDPKPIPSNRRLLLTGTPMLGKPKKLWPIVRAADPNGLGKSYPAFAERYCGGHTTDFGYNDNGASNTAELQERMRSTFMVRPNKEEALKDLPPKRRILYPLPQDGLVKHIRKEADAVQEFSLALARWEALQGGQDAPTPTDTPVDVDAALARHGALMADLFEAIQDGRVSYADIANRYNSAVVDSFENLSAARRDLALAKLPMTIRKSQEVVDSGEKLVAFCIHKEVAEMLRDAFPGCAFVTGKVASARRQPEIDRFQTNETCRVAVGNIHAMGRGFTMTASRWVDFHELHWVWDDVEQAEDRVWRRGQTNHCMARHFVVEGTLDERMVEVNTEKRETNYAVLDRSAHSVAA